MLVTLSGIEIDVSPEQPENALSAIVVTVFPPRMDGMAILPEAGETLSTVAESPAIQNVQV